jgi:hypothetical protein
LPVAIRSSAETLPIGDTTMIQVFTKSGDIVSLESLLREYAFNLILYRQTVGCGKNDAFFLAIEKVWGTRKKPQRKSVGVLIAYINVNADVSYEICMGDFDKKQTPDRTDIADSIESALDKIATLVTKC